MATTTLIIEQTGTTTYQVDNYPYYDGPNLQEFLLIGVIIILFLSVPFYRFIFNVPKT